MSSRAEVNQKKLIMLQINDKVFVFEIAMGDSATAVEFVSNKMGKGGNLPVTVRYSARDLLEVV